MSTQQIGHIEITELYNMGRRRSGRDIYAKAQVVCPTPGCPEMVTFELLMGHVNRDNLEILAKPLKDERNRGIATNGICQNCGAVVGLTNNTLKTVIAQVKDWARIARIRHLMETDTPEYLPLSRSEIIDLLQLVWEMSDDSRVINLVQRRLERAIPGISSPHPTSGPVAARLFSLGETLTRHEEGPTASLIGAVADILDV